MCPMTTLFLSVQRQHEPVSVSNGTMVSLSLCNDNMDPLSVPNEKNVSFCSMTTWNMCLCPMITSFHSLYLNDNSLILFNDNMELVSVSNDNTVPLPVLNDSKHVKNKIYTMMNPFSICLCTMISAYTQ